jgi:parallel beta helix pectate lyase-like protein
MHVDRLPRAAMSLGFCAALFVYAAAASEPKSIVGCGAPVSAREVARLDADLDCSGLPDGVVIHQGTLLLNGHTITGATNAGIQCSAGCKIVGPGEVTRSAWGIVGFNQFTAGTVRISNASLHDNENAGLAVASGDDVRGSVKLENIDASHNGASGIWVAARRLRATGLTTVGNAAHGVLTPPNGATKITGLTATGNLIGVNGPRGGRLVLKGSRITSNTSGIDVYSETRPILVETTCDHSAGMSPDPINPNGLPWGICGGD